MRYNYGVPDTPATYPSNVRLNLAHLARFLDDQYVRRFLGNGLAESIADVIRTSHYNVSAPGAPLGRAEAIAALERLGDHFDVRYGTEPRA